MIRAVLVVGIAVHRESLAMSLQASGITVVGSLSPLDAPLSCIEEAAPDVVLLDLAPLVGLPLIRSLRHKARSPLGVVIIGRSDQTTELARWCDEGASSIIGADQSLDDMVHAITMAAVGGPVATKAGRTHLTDRESEIISLIDHGLSNREIATTLGISMSTVKNHVHHILEKLHVRRRGQATARIAGR